MRQKLLLLIAVVFGLLAFVLTYRQLESEKDKIRNDSETVVLIRLKRSMVEGEELKEGDIMRFPVRRQRNSGEISREIPWSEASRVIDRRLEASIGAGQILQNTDLKPLTQRQGFTGSIKSGQRAVTIPVDAVSAVNHLIQPYDNVDVIGTFRFPDVRGDTALDTVTLTLLQNVKVLAVGGRWSAAINPGAPVPYSTVTLLVWPDEVEMLIFASQKGRLQLALRNFEDEIIERNIESHSVNFKQLEQEIPRYNQRRDERRMLP